MVIIYVNILVRSIKILTGADGKIQRSGLVHRPFHLIDMPVCAKERRICNTHVRTHTFHLLRIPEREGIVVTMGYQDTVRAYGVEIVLRHLDCSITVASVMVIPVFRRHESRNSKEEDSNGSGNCCLALALFRKP